MASPTPRRRGAGTLPTVPNVGVLSGGSSANTPTIMGTPVVFGGDSPGGYRHNPITLPAGIQVGELVVLVMRVQTTGAVFDDSVGTDWDLLVDRRDMPGSNRGMVIFGWPCRNQTAIDTIVNTTPVLGVAAGTRSVYICFRLAGVDLDNPVEAIAATGTSLSSTFELPAYNYRPRSKVFTAFGTESTSGQPVDPTSVDWVALEKLTTTTEPLNPAVSRTSLTLYSAPVATRPPTPIQTADYGASVAAIGGMSWAFRSKTPPPPLPGIPTVTQLAASRNFKVGHRGSSRNWPEFSLHAYTEAARYGVQALEISLNRTSDGVWFGMHDADLGRVSGDPNSTDPTTLTWDDLNANFEILGSTANLDPTQPNRPFARFEEIAAAFPYHVLIIDPKYRWSVSERSEFFALLDTYGGGLELDGTPTTSQQRCIIKSYCTSVGPNGVAPLSSAEGYTTWGYFYDADFANWATYEPHWDWLSVDESATAPNWATAVAAGKPVVGHVIGAQAAADSVYARGARGIISSNVRGIAYPQLIPG